MIGYFLALMVVAIHDCGFNLADPRTWAPLTKSFITYGILPLMGILFCELASYFNPEDMVTQRAHIIMSRLSMAAGIGYLLLAPISIIALISKDGGPAGSVVLLAVAAQCISFSVAFIGTARMNYMFGSPIENILNKKRP